MQEKEGSEFVVPGQLIESDKQPGQGVYKEGGKTYASVVGEVKNLSERVFVKPSNEVVELQRGDAVIGNVETVRDKMVVVRILKVVGKSRTLPTERFGVVKITDISNSYIDKAQDEFKIGDVVKALVVQVLPNDVLLSTKKGEMGVIEAYCSQCRGLLELADGKLVCSVCGKSERRRMSSDYLIKKEG